MYLVYLKQAEIYCKLIKCCISTHSKFTNIYNKFSMLQLQKNTFSYSIFGINLLKDRLLSYWLTITSLDVTIPKYFILIFRLPRQKSSARWSISKCGLYITLVLIYSKLLISNLFLNI